MLETLADQKEAKENETKLKNKKMTQQFLCGCGWQVIQACVCCADHSIYATAYL